jgi:hypothetical protein
MKAVLRIFGNFDTTWNSMKKFLSTRGIIESIIDFDPRSITPEVRKDVDSIIQQHANSFEKAVIYRASLAAGPLSEWVKATLSFSAVLEQIRPLEGQIQAFEKKLEASRNRLKECQT